MLKRMILTLVIVILLSSCNNNQNAPTEETTETEQTTEETTEQPTETEPEIIVKEGVPSPISGLYYPQELTELRPMAIVLDNHPSSRWQAGITKAEIVYECEVEGPFTRYLAIFLTESPEHIGPVRSARPYFLTFALEFDAVFVHVGGSNEALLNIRDYQMANISGMTSGEFWRYYDTGKTAPNNMYTAMKNLRDAQSYMNYRQEANYEVWNFSEDPYPLADIYDSQSVSSFSITYNKDYHVRYDLKEDTGKYNRYVNDKLQIDEYFEDEIVATNIIVQKLRKAVLDNEGRLALYNISDGEGYYISNGEMIEISWEKTSIRGRTIYKDKDGNEILLNPGQTWIQVISQNTVLEFEESLDG
jgi:PBP1b-binding outer membrane lipoprotein LpoB